MYVSTRFLGAKLSVTKRRGRASRIRVETENMIIIGEVIGGFSNELLIVDIFIVDAV